MRKCLRISALADFANKGSILIELIEPGGGAARELARRSNG
jgi:hypothetical protein